MEPKRRKLNSKELEVDENGFAVPESADHDKKILGYLEIVTTEANKSPDVQQGMHVFFESQTIFFPHEKLFLNFSIQPPLQKSMKN